MPRGARRRWQSPVDDDPGAGLINLFDVWIAFSVALLLALVSYLNVRAPGPGRVESGQADALEAGDGERPAGRQIKLERYRVTTQSRGGEGTRLGTAYRLKSGEVVYVPDDPRPAPR
jgi:hypothetical protein